MKTLTGLMWAYRFLVIAAHLHIYESSYYHHDMEIAMSHVSECCHLYFRSLGPLLFWCQKVSEILS